MLALAAQQQPSWSLICAAMDWAVFASWSQPFTPEDSEGLQCFNSESSSWLKVAMRSFFGTMVAILQC